MSLSATPPQGLPEYEDAEAYDEENPWHVSDDFYLELATQIGGPVLDAGCGTGRLTRAIAEAGLEVTGLDITAGMLERARTLDKENRVEWLHADARTMQLGRTFRLIIMTGHAFQHLLTDDDISAFLQRAREHLQEDGYLAFETRNYAAKTYPSYDEPTYWYSIEDSQGRDVDIYLAARYDPETGIEHLIGERRVRETGERQREESTLRFVSLEHLNEMLDRHGFSIVEQYGTWSKAPVGEDKPEFISICRLSTTQDELKSMPS